MTRKSIFLNKAFSLTEGGHGTKSGVFSRSVELSMSGEWVESLDNPASWRMMVSKVSRYIFGAHALFLHICRLKVVRISCRNTGSRSLCKGAEGRQDLGRRSLTTRRLNIRTLIITTDRVQYVADAPWTSDETESGI